MKDLAENKQIVSDGVTVTEVTKSASNTKSCRPTQEEACYPDESDKAIREMFERERPCLMPDAFRSSGHGHSRYEAVPARGNLGDNPESSGS